MTDVATMLNAYPGTLPEVDQDLLVLSVQECLNCAQVCTACADACAADPGAAHLGRCTGAALTCADIVTAAVRVLSRPTSFDPEVAAAALRALDEACRACDEECRKHALEIEACRVCSEACRRCAQACRQLLDAPG